MATASISGLASGLDTATIISQLMQLEAVPQDKLKTQVSTEQAKLTALQQINTALTTLASAATSLATASTTSGTWGALSTTSSNNAITATAGTSTMPGTVTVRVEAKAASASTSIDATVALAPNATFTVRDSGGAAVLDAQGQPVTFTTDADPDLGELAASINATASATSLRAVVVHGRDGDVLQLSSTKSGAASNFSITDGTQTFAATNAADGLIKVNGVDVTSSSNTYSSVVDGLSVTVGADAAVGAESTITIARDAASRSNAVKGLVDNVNSVLTMMATQTTADADKSKSGVLAGDGTVRQVASSLVEALYPGGNQSMAQFGLQVDRSGKLVFDAAKFASAYAADPAATTAAFTGPDGFGSRVQKAAQAASDKYTGTVTSAITGRTTTIDRLNQNIAAWDDRLALRRTTLERQYTALETALSKLNSQSSWLSAQIESLSSDSK